MNNMERIITKVTSGQWIMTVSIAVTFPYLAISGIIPPDTSALIIMSVIIYYFKRDRTDPKPEDTELSNRT